MSSAATDDSFPKEDKGDSGGDSLFSQLPDPSPTPSSNIPKTIARPLSQKDEKDYGSLLAESQKQYRSFAEEQQYQIQRYHELNDKYSAQSKPILQSIIDAQMHLDDAPPDIPRDPAIQKLAEAYQQKNPGGINNIFQMIMLSLALAFSAFGWKRGWGARAGIMEGWGNAFRAFGQAKKEDAKDQLDRTYELQKLAWEENKERHQQLQDIYTNRRLSLAEKSKVFDEVEKLYGMDVNQIKNENSMTGQQMKLLQTQMRVQRDLLKLQLTTHNKVHEFMFNTMPGKKWREVVMAETIKKDSITGGKLVDPARSEDELAHAEEILPYEDFLKKEKSIGKADPKDPTGQTTVGVPQIQKPGQPTLQTKMHGWLDKYQSGK